MMKLGLGGRTRTDSLLLPKQAVYLIDITPRGVGSRFGFHSNPEKIPQLGWGLSRYTGNVFEGEANEKALPLAHLQT